MATAHTVTLLFTDLVGSTVLLEQLGDDAADRLRRAHLRLLRDAVAPARSLFLLTGAVPWA
jgi:class 3 adenylate cyclase